MANIVTSSKPSDLRLLFMKMYERAIMEYFDSRPGTLPCWINSSNMRPGNGASSFLGAETMQNDTKTYYVLKSLFGYCNLGDNGMREFECDVEKAKRYNTPTDALTDIQDRLVVVKEQHRGTKLLSSGFRLFRVEETTTPGAKKLSLSSTLEPTNPTDCFVVIVDYGTIGLCVAPTNPHLSVGGHGRTLAPIESRNFDGIDEFTFATQADAIRSAGQRDYSREMYPARLVGIRRLVIEEGKPKVTRVETELK